MIRIKAPNAAPIVGAIAGIDETRIAAPCKETVVKEPSELTKAIRWVSRYNGKYSEIFALKKIVVTEGWRHLTDTQLADLLKFAKNPTQWTGKTMQFKKINTDDKGFEALTVCNELLEGEDNDYNI